ncbi:MAG: radical SAM protein [Bacteroidota bacterium]
MVKHFTIPIFVPELACPFKCVFCDQRKISGALQIPSIEEVDHTIQTHLSTISAEKSHIEIGFFGGNFTGIPKEQQRLYLTAAQKYIDNGSAVSIRLSTRPDYINASKIELLKEFSVKTVELGAQSMDNGVLIKTGRGHDSEKVIESSNLLKNEGFSLGLQMMLGLPGDSIEKCIHTANQIVKINPSDVRIYPTLVIEGTELADLFREGKYEPLSLQTAVEWTKEVFKIFEEAGINIIRVGLHPSEELTNKKSLLAGPYHASFRELVLSELWKDRLINKLEFKKSKSIIIYVAEHELNYVVGYGSSNKKFLETKFESVKIKADKKLTNYSFYADCY